MMAAVFVFFFGEFEELVDCQSDEEAIATGGGGGTAGEADRNKLFVRSGDTVQESEIADDAMDFFAS